MAVQTFTFYADDGFYYIQVKLTTSDPSYKYDLLKVGHIGLPLGGTKVTAMWSVTIAGSSVATGSQTFNTGTGFSKNLSNSYTVSREKVSKSVSLVFRVQEQEGTSLSVNSDTENWTLPAKPSYNVTYNGNGSGATGVPLAQTKWYGETLKLATDTPTRDNYEFYHWNTATNNSGTTYSAGGYYTDNTALNLYAIWNPIIRYAGGGESGAIVGNLPPNQVKTYGVTLKLSTTVPVRNGYQFDGWYTNSAYTGTKYNPGANFTSNTATTLYAKWIKLADKPTISSISVVRSDSNGDADDTGTYCKVTAVWSVDTTSPTITGNTGTVTGTIKEDGAYTTRSITFSSGASGTSGTAQALVSGCDTDKQYVITITVTDLAASTSRSDIMTRAFFTMDFKAGGSAIGIGVAAPSNGLEVGWDAQFDGDMNILGDIFADNLQEIVETTAANVISATGNWTVSGASIHRYGKLCSLVVNARSSVALSANQSYAIGFISSDYAPSSTNYVTGAFMYGSAYILTQIVQNIPRTILFVRPFESVSANTTINISLTYYAW